MIERLENRRLLAVIVEYDVARQVLRFFGDERSDEVRFARTSPGSGETLRAVVDGVEEVYTSPIRLISMSMGEGADLVALGQINIPAFVRGGKGPDSLSGGTADDTLLGEGGFDYIFGREGADSLDGGLQGDTLFGSIGNDRISSGSALSDNDDTISGGEDDDLVDYSTAENGLVLQIGDFTSDPAVVSDFIHADIETLIGTEGDDFIRNATRRGLQIDGRGGNDSLRGGSGDETLIGGDGADTLEGTGGNDTFDALDNAIDTINGGGGDNVLRSQDLSIDLITLVP